MADKNRLDTPGRRRTEWMPRMRMDQDAFGSFAESFARLMGTAGFLFWMTLLIVFWFFWNIFDLGAPDRWPFAFLTLALSLQASYAAPLILLAQNRQEARDRVSLEHDREVSAQSRADMDFLAREIASLRMRMSDVATRDFIRSELRELLAELQAEDDGEKSA
ncbi:DUF1003 domain-containing protein [Propionicimonas sp.]|uniref:DUF1003 domain-containing protein n=1 Tax=Propionicimonas sp. TaxID=1955623 RepID=UPI0018199181|nr:DUF1003 domain-containing protein [Propionicimonas sp.]MBU3977944.1 DUF1003 domain-containing protein [Actinomycetota bacterium]MBA3021833.1 DUF1003 domain-containing protein [Propionicimonas sp.]MBU3985388.1 DUF1003 domain-containing protein [Actinomycetota bacterium]MBU4007483.1 DUF1003 domain-containing protein [Actinomycetota bacterium]MBU4066623.1 DUF1003 domain-containing protein [Actinomycetota bacterium]